MSQYSRNNNELLKEQSLEYLGGKICLVCKTNHLPICCYDFHHSKGAKEEEISKMIQRKRILDDELRRELDKCKVMCANCHRMVNNKLINLIESERLRNNYQRQHDSDSK